MIAAVYKFTGKERDSESGLDNFGARYNASSMGRFMTPDPKIPSLKHLLNPAGGARLFCREQFDSGWAGGTRLFCREQFDSGWRVAHPPDARLLWVPQPSRFSKAGSREFQINSAADSGSPANTQVRKSSARADHTFLFARKSFKTRVQKSQRS